MYLNSWDVHLEGQVLGRAPGNAIFWIFVCNLLYNIYGCIPKCYKNFYLRLLLNNDIFEIVGMISNIFHVFFYCVGVKMSFIFGILGQYQEKKNVISSWPPFFLSDAKMIHSYRWLLRSRVHFLTKGSLMKYNKKPKIWGFIKQTFEVRTVEQRHPYCHPSGTPPHHFRWSWLIAGVCCMPNREPQFYGMQRIEQLSTFEFYRYK